jgi:HAD superfamily hydrolase (TIGR01509 family)
VDTEKDGHRVAFNRAFASMGYKFEWDVELYGKLLKVAGGKERMKHFFDTTSWPDGDYKKDSLIKQLHKLKTDLFMQIIESGELSLRPGVMRIVDEAIKNNLALAVCSTSNERAVNTVISRLFGPERREKFLILAGDIVSKKKPDPEIYNLALKLLKMVQGDCIVIEDSKNGLLAAKAAGIPCVITTNHYTRDEDFTGAELVVEELGDPPKVNVTMDTLRNLKKKA